MGIYFELNIDKPYNMPGEGEWRGILHLKEKTVKEWCCSIGSRVPAFLYNVNSRVVRIFFPKDGKADWSVDTPPLGKENSSVVILKLKVCFRDQ